MDTKRLYSFLVILLPVVYLFHNLEEWLKLRSDAVVILHSVPKSIGSYLPHDPSNLVLAFGIAVVVATIIPIIISIVLWRRFSKLSDNLLMVIGFATLYNVLSHVSSTLFLGFITPGFITAVILCVPYIIGIAIYSFKYSHITMSRMFVLGIISLPVYFGMILLSWLVAVLIMAPMV